MSQTLIDRYQPGGDIYASYQTRFGTDGANAIAYAALSGDESAVNAAIVQAQYGAPLSESTWGIFGEELATDPLAAPLDGLDTVIKKSLGDVIGNPFVFLAIGAGIFLYFGGLKYLEKQFLK